MPRCDQEMCPNWDGSGCPCEVLDLDRTFDCVAPPGNLCTETGCWDADRCVVARATDA